jgi:hypothetical protein
VYFTTFPTVIAGTGFSSTFGNPVVINNGSYLVWASEINLPPTWTSNGTTFASVGGTFTSTPRKTAGAFGNNVWCMLTSLNGTTGERFAIQNANPTGTWTVDQFNFGMTICQEMAFGNGIFVIVGSSDTATSGKIFTTTNPATNSFTDRTTSLGVTFPSTPSGPDSVVFTGTHFVLRYQHRYFRSTNGASWTETTSTNTFTTTNKKMVTDGNGKIIIPISLSPLTVLISYDHGATWGAAQLSLGNIPTGGGSTTLWLSFTNNKWFENHSGQNTSIRDFGSFSATPDSVGIQAATANTYVRIK